MRVYWLVFTILVSWCAVTSAQMIALQTPLQSNSSNFYERTGFSWGIDLPGSGNVVGFSRNGQFTPDGSIPIRFGAPNAALAPFGNPNPAADTTLGFAWRNGGGGGFLNLALAQSSNRVNSMVAPSLTVTEGYPGAIFDGQVRPFVTGLVPFVGGHEFQPAPPVIISPLQSRIARMHELQSSPASGATVRSTPVAPEEPVGPVEQLQGQRQSSASQGDLSLREIRAQRAAEGDSSPLESLLAKAKAAESDGRLYAARQYLRQAARRAPADERRELIDSELARLNQQISAPRDR